MIAVLGGAGSIGSRYVSILKYLDIEHVAVDPAINMMEIPRGVKKLIIATPTPQHVHHCLIAEEKKIPYLCEKPLSTDLEQARVLEGSKLGYMVCNYKYLVGTERNPNIDYDYYKTGSDGLYWDCAQLLYLDPNATLRTNSPRWNLQVNHRWVPYRVLEQSYVNMIRDFVAGSYQKLWTIQQGIDMVRVVKRRIENEKVDCSPSKKQFFKVAGENLSSNPRETDAPVGT